MKIEVLALEPPMPAYRSDPRFHGVQRVLGQKHQHRPWLIHLESAEAGSPGSHADW